MQNRPYRHCVWQRSHRLSGTAAALVVVFVESIVVTYFIGTSRWCREVVQTYQLDPAPAEASQRLKRRAFPLALAGMLVVVAIGALGAASDPATGRPGTHDWVNIHLIAAMAGFGIYCLDLLHGVELYRLKSCHHQADRG